MCIAFYDANRNSIINLQNYLFTDMASINQPPIRINFAVMVSLRQPSMRI
jgi:hypothetical protein